MRKPFIIALVVVALMIVVPAVVLGGFSLAGRGGDGAALRSSDSSDGDPTPGLA